MSENVAPSPIVRPGPDPERDARVARRRAADAARAGRALDDLLAPERNGMSHLYDCCPAAPTQPHTEDCGLYQVHNGE